MMTISSPEEEAIRSRWQSEDAAWENAMIEADMAERDLAAEYEAALTASRAEADALRGEVERLRAALDDAETACDDRADRLDDFGPESECCAATARNCSADVAAARAAQVPDGGK